MPLTTIIRHWSVVVRLHVSLMKRFRSSVMVQTLTTILIQIGTILHSKPLGRIAIA